MAHPPATQTDAELVARISRSAGQKAGYKQLIRELGMGGGRERRLLLEQLGRLVAHGQLVSTEENMWALPKREAPTTSPGRDGGTGRPTFQGMEAHVLSGRDRLISGRLDVHRDGFGFVRPDAGQGGRPAEDIFIPPNEIHGAVQGVLVLVDGAPRGREGRRSGRIARVLTRRNPTVVGVFHYGTPSRRRERGD